MHKLKDKFLEELLSWHKINPRPLPWKEDRNPYKIWISEIILQQTRVEQGTPYYLRFIEAFPDVHSLASADIDQVLKLWEGLGYYSRARNLHESAKQIIENHNGRIPDSYDSLIELPGIGDYTASAIASFAFEKPYAVVDGNVKRVVSRVFGIEEAMDTSTAKKKVKQIVQSLCEQTSPSEFNQAIMNFGAIQCTPNNPDCSTCPVALFCEAKKKQIVNRLPFKSKSVEKTTRYLHFILLFDQDNLLIGKREKKDIWKGLYQFPIIEKLQKDLLSFSELNAFASTYADQFICFEPSQEFKHKLTHRLIKARFYKILCNNISKYSAYPYKSVGLNSLDNYAFPRLLHIYLNKEKTSKFKS